MTDFAQRQLDRLAAGTLERVIAMTPIGRVGQAAEIAAAIDFLTSPQAAFVAGHVLNVDGAPRCERSTSPPMSVSGTC
jgi:NAD(P)-dependent dehydrogenase (short-subunit alcohol dehydrogenase family)